MNDVEEIKSRLDIADVVAGFFPLKKSGRNFKAVCPFHTEKTPSFVVNSERQTWHCFGACGTGGDVISFVMRKEGFEFGEALALLAEMAGIELKKPSGKVGVNKTASLYSLNQEAVKFYRQVLQSELGVQAQRYLEDRGIDQNMVSSFELGLSPKPRSSLMSHLSALGLDLDLAVEARLLRRNDRAKTQDFFWGRLMIPIHDRRGRVVGFGGRSMDGSEPKYINTAASSIFDKQATLYALHKAADPIKNSDTAVIVEGYMDAITAHQHGYSNVVASMGTALTESQVGQLKSLANNFVMALDSDDAGQEAVLRSLESSWKVVERLRVGTASRGIYRKEKLNLKIASLPEGKDPDQVIRDSTDQWETLIDTAVPYIEFMIRAVIDKHDIRSIGGKSAAAEAVSPLILSVSDAIEQDHYMYIAANLLEIRREILVSAIGKFRGAGRQDMRRRSISKDTRFYGLDERNGDRLGDYVLSLLLKFPEFKEFGVDLVPEYLQNTESRIVLSAWLETDSIEGLQDMLDENLKEHFEYITSVDLGPVDQASAEKAFIQGVERLENRHYRELQLSRLASEDSSIPPPKEYEQEFVGYNKRLKQSS